MTRIKHYALTHPLSTGYLNVVNRRVIFDEVDGTYGPANTPTTTPVPVGAEITMTFTANPHPIRYKEARRAAKLIPGSVVVRVS